MRKITVLAFLCFSIQSYAQIITDRPDQTESSNVVPLGSLQIESGLLLSFEDGEIESQRDFFAPTTLFRYGITKPFELRLLTEYQSQSINGNSFDGFSDIQIGTKIQIFQKEDVNTEIAFLSHLITPTGTNELTINEFGTINKLSISHSLNERTGIGYNIGYDDIFSDDVDGDLTFSLALGTSINDKIGVYIEPFGAITSFNDFFLNADAGFTYLPKDNLQLDASFGTGINNQNNYSSIGLSWIGLRN